MRLSLVAIIPVVVECTTLFLIFFPVVHYSQFILFYSPCRYGAGFVGAYTFSISFHYLDVRAVYGVFGGHQLLDAERGMEFCFGNS